MQPKKYSAGAVTGHTSVSIAALSVVLFNARSLNNKLPELQHLLCTCSYDIVCVTETWLTSETANCVVLGGCQYSIFRADRSVPHRGGGVCIITKSSSVKATKISLPLIFAHLEMCVIDILYSGAKTRIFVCYRPTSSNTDSDAIRYISEMCECLSSLYPPNGAVIICGDFNFPTITWSIDNCLNCSNSTCTGIFLEFFYTHGLRQLVTEPTRGENILDLVFCNDTNCVLNTRSIEPFSTSDHNQVLFDILNYTTSVDYSVCTRDFKSADWNGMRSYLAGADFFQLFQRNLPPTEIITKFYEIINECIDLHVPMKCVVNPERSHKQKYPAYIQRKIRKKATAWRTYRAFKTPESLASYKRIASQCKSAIYSHVLFCEKQLIDRGNLGKFYRYANKKFSSKSPVGPLFNSDGSLTADPKEKALILQQAFTQNFTVDNGHLPCASNFGQSSCKLSRILFTGSLIRRAIKKLKVKTSGGPDGIPPSFFTNCIDDLCYPLSLLFTFSFEHGILPAAWLISFITPVFKKGNPASANNYRPIALTSVMCKLMEAIIKDQIVHFLTSKGLISKRQHAFLKNHSTASNLLECLQDWSIGLNSHSSTDIVYIDFSKAFDSIVHSKLLFKLELYGISGHLLKWISSFLSNRMQCVVTDYFYSPICSVISGVPQGSVLGPILFIIYVNDIDSVCCGDTTMQLFADDAKLYSNVVVDSASTSLQLSLDRLTQWANVWQLHININKCSVLPVTSMVCLPVRQYYINGVTIPCHNSYVDLGVAVTSNLSFELHINNIVSKARQRISILFRGFLTRNLYIMRQSFITYIRPILEYNSVVWNPSFIYLIDVIEHVQRNFSKRIRSISTLPYLERLALLDLEPLELRRLRFDLTYYFKVFNNLTPFDPNDIFTIYTPAASLRSNSPYLQKPTKASNKLLHTLFYRNVDAWNSLPIALRCASSLHLFKSTLKRVDLSRFLKGSVF